VPVLLDLKVRKGLRGYKERRGPKGLRERMERRALKA
jgi:hypothetical protein